MPEMGPQISGSDAACSDPVSEHLVCGVVISYKPSPEIVGNVEVLRSQMARVVVVDNTETPDAATLGVLASLEQIPGCTVLRNGRNLGIAAALNIGIRHAIAEGFSWIATFDQDSRIRGGYVDAMLSAYRSAASGNIGMLCPRYEDARLGTALPIYRDAHGDVFACMTSGAMMEAKMFERIGPMEEAFFIDYVDLEYCLRMRAAGLKIMECKSAVLTHSLGRMTQHRILGRSFSATNHSAKRRYYITRNRVVLMRRYFSTHRDWVVADLKGMAMEAVIMLLVERDRMAKIGYMMRALYDGACNRLGPGVAL